MSIFEIEIQIEENDRLPVDRVRSKLKQAARATLEAEAVAAPAGLTLLLTSNERIHDLNRRYRQVDKPTDVLSFPAERHIPGLESYLGDVAIAVPVARAQAEAAGHPLLSELILLTVHGVLHLLGHDHLDPAEKEAMWSSQDRILALLNLDLRSPD